MFSLCVYACTQWTIPKIWAILSQLITPDGHWHYPEHSHTNQIPIPIQCLQQSTNCVGDRKFISCSKFIFCAMEIEFYWAGLHLINWARKWAFAFLAWLTFLSWSNKCINTTAMMNNKYKYIRWTIYSNRKMGMSIKQNCRRSSVNCVPFGHSDPLVGLFTWWRSGFIGCSMHVMNVSVI